MQMAFYTHSSLHNYSHSAQSTCRDMLVVLPQFMRPCDHLPFSDPLLQVVHLPVELE